jgi:uncharacterized protein DUF4326
MRWHPGSDTTTGAAQGTDSLALTSAASPARVQLSRAKGWRMPPNTVRVSRPGKWGNPFRIGDIKWFVNDADPDDRVVIYVNSNAEAVAAFRWLAAQEKYRTQVVAELRGKNLACWCKPGEPCHADVLLEIANATPPDAPRSGVTETGGELGPGKNPLPKRGADL